MEYRFDSRSGNNISLLGFGAMRLKTIGTNVDMDLATDLLKYAVDNGINYIDTAYLYGNGSGSNERAIGEILDNLGYRDKVFLSTKMNRLAICSRSDMDEMFSSQLSNLRTSCIDYYFLHNIISYSDVTKLIDMGLLDFIEDKKSKGEIVNMGFSFHGSFDDFKKILDLYDWDVTLLQYNYLDSNIQAGIDGIRLAGSYGMSVIIMEPLKGGLLAGNMPDEIQNLLDDSASSRSNVDLALSWIFEVPEITCVLSGMNTGDMLKENIGIVDKFSSNHLSDEEFALIDSMRDVFLRLNKIGCTSCNYCMPCPKGVDIPNIFKLYNDQFLFPSRGSFVNNPLFMYSANILGITGEAHDASRCVDCGLCITKCPQGLDIPSLIRMVDKKYHGRLVRPFIPVLKRIMKHIM